MSDGGICSSCGASQPAERVPCGSCGDTRRTFHETITETVHASVTFEAGVRRGPESWNYFYMVGGVALAILLAIIPVLDIPWWARVIYLVCAAVFVVGVIISSGWLHNMLIGLKNRYEGKFR
jgi:hypothetical protein